MSPEVTLSPLLWRWATEDGQPQEGTVDELVRVAWTPAPEEAVSQRTTSWAIVPFVAAFIAGLAS